ncbi:hypothetical protein [Zunongwangia sp. H14]|uniref:hypothetical protein n=1 Tax=Zunongwangia sp. H14 TaxID=3240792 RepID=UPI003563A5E0
MKILIHQMHRYLIILLSIFFSLSVQGQITQPENDLENCVSKSTESSYYESVGFYQMMQEMEDRMIKDGLIKNRKKEEYLKLFEKLSKTNDSLKFKEYFNRNFEYMEQKFSFNLFTVNSAVFNQCPYKISSSIENKNEELVYQTGKRLYQIMESGFLDLKLIKNLVKFYSEQDFSKKVYRAPITYLALININYQYSPYEIEFRKYKESKILQNKN